MKSTIAFVASVALAMGGIIMAKNDAKDDYASRARAAAEAENEAAEHDAQQRAGAVAPLASPKPAPKPEPKPSADSKPLLVPTPKVEPVKKQGWEDYRDAYTSSSSESKPLVILVGAEWCSGCNRLKQEIEADFAPNANYVYVDLDAEPDFSKEIMAGTDIPQVIIYEKDGDKWNCARFKGRTTGAAVKQRVCGGAEAKLTSAASPCANPDCTCDPCECGTAPVEMQTVQEVEFRTVAPTMDFQAGQPARNAGRAVARGAKAVALAPVRVVQRLRENQPARQFFRNGGVFRRCR